MLSNRMDFILRLTTPSDIPALLEFERDNRAFFEKFVPPRPANFFNTPDAFQIRMLELFADQLAGTYLMFILCDGENRILGRINLTISEGVEAAVGYRIGHAHTGAQLAYRALKKLEPIAVRHHNITKLTAEAASTNPASIRTLNKAGFSCNHKKTRTVSLQNTPIILQSYEKELLSSS